MLWREFHNYFESNWTQAWHRGILILKTNSVKSCFPCKEKYTALQLNNGMAEYPESSGVMKRLGFYSSKSICQSTAILQTLLVDFPHMRCLCVCQLNSRQLKLAHTPLACASDLVFSSVWHHVCVQLHKKTPRKNWSLQPKIEVCLVIFSNN